MLYEKTDLAAGFFFKVKSTKLFDYAELPSKRIWIEKFHHKYLSQHPNDATHKTTYDNHADYIPEFSQITGIAIGTIGENILPNRPYAINCIDLTGGTEKDMLTMLSTLMDKTKAGTVIAGWNISNYQIPFVVKRMLINKVKIPRMLDLLGKKPWDIRAIDVMRDYQGNMFGDIDQELVALQFGVQSDTSIAATELKTTMDIALAMST